MRAIIGRLVLLAVAAVVVVGPVRAPVQAESYDYAPKTRQVKACVLLLESFVVTHLGGPQMENPDPYVFYVLDTKADKLKPRDWEIVNPLAPRVVTPDIKDRWDDIDPGHPYTLNEPVTKNMGCYWEVTLSNTSIEDLLQFDLVGVMTHATGGFSTEDSAKLRRLVDQGGTFWFDDCAGATLTATKPFFIREFNYDHVDTVANPGSPTLAVADRLHPVLNSPFSLTTQELEQLGDKTDQYAYRITNLARTGPPDPALAPIVYTRADFGDGRTYAVTAGGHYGDGTVMITSGDIACSINDRFIAGNGFATTSGNNSGAYCGDLPVDWDSAKQARLDCNMKFVFNLLNWTAGESNHRKGAHRTAYTRDEVTPGLDALWKVPLGPSVTLSSAPVVWRDFAFFATDDRRIFAVDTRPGEDRDGKDDSGAPRDGTVAGNPNDGSQMDENSVVDLTSYSPYDVIWRYPSDPATPALASAPVGMFVATVVRNGAPVDALFFSTSDGNLHALEATPMVTNTATNQPILADRQRPDLAQEGELSGFPVALAATAVDAISPPVFSRHNVFVVTREGATYYMHVIDMTPASLTPVKVPLAPAGADDAQTVILPPVTSALVPNERTGGTADVAYATLPNGAVAGVTVRVYGEVADPKETPYPPVGEPGRIYDQDSTAFLLQYPYNRTDYQATVLDGNNQPVTWTPTFDTSGAPRQLSVVRDPGPPVQSIPEGHRVVVDYGVDPAGSVHSLTLMPGYGGAPSPPTGAVLSGAAVSTGDAACFASANGFVECLAERGTWNQPGDLNKVLWRCNVNDYQEDTTGAFLRVREPTTPPATPVFDNSTWVPAWWQRDTALATGGRWIPLPPAATEGMVYLAMNKYVMNAANQPTELLGGAVFAFDQMSSLTVDLSRSVDGTAYTAAQVTDPRVTTYMPEGNAAAPAGWRPLPRATAANPSGYWDARTDGAKTWLVFARFDNLLTLCSTMHNQAGVQIPNLWVDVDGGGTEPARPFLANGRYSNLVWRYPDVNWTAQTARAQWVSGVTTAPTVSGGVVYVALGDGRLFGLDADPRDGGKPVGATPAGTAIADDGIHDAAESLMLAGLGMPREWTAAQRVPPDVLGIWPGLDPEVDPNLVRTYALAPLIRPGAAIAATSSLVLLPRNDFDSVNGTHKSGTLYALSRPVYTVADAKRMMEIDGDARVLSVMAEAKGGADQKALNHPAGARFAGHLSVDGQATIFADSGNNRVVAVDRSGGVVWEATEVYDLDDLLPAGEFEVENAAHAPLVPGPGTFDAWTNVHVSKLRTPTDVRSWESADVKADGTPDPTIKVHHTLIADAGSYRVIEIVDKWRWDAATQQWVRLQRADAAHGNPYWYHVVVWASQTRSRHQDLFNQWQIGQNYRYNSLQVVDYYPFYGGYVRRVLATVSNYALYQSPDGRRRQKMGASLVVLDAAPKLNTTTGSWTSRSSIVDDPAQAGEKGYTSFIGNSVYATQPRPMSGLGSIQRYLFGWTTATGPVWHYIYADSSGIYEWLPKTGKESQIPLDSSGFVDSSCLFTQFWREQYENLLWQATDPPDWPRGGDPRQFQPAAVSIDPAGGWIVANRVFDRTLSRALTVRQRTDEARRIQVFKLASTPSPSGDYVSSAANFGYTWRSARWLFGPELRDMRGRDLRVDLAQPLYALRSR